MQRPPRGAWSGFDQMKPASEYDIRYGHHLVRIDKLAVAELRRHCLAHRVPDDGAAPDAPPLRRWDTRQRWTSGYLKEFTEGLPDDVDLVVGIGGRPGTGRQQVRRAYQAASSRADTDHRIDGSDYSQRFCRVGGP